MKFGAAFNEASGACLTREGNDAGLKASAAKNAQAIAAGHSFIIVMRDGFPINILGRIKDVPEVVGTSATANPGSDRRESEQGRGISA
jgi:adenosine/AMP kinase